MVRDMRSACRFRPLIAVVDGSGGDDRDLVLLALCLWGDLSEREGLSQFMMPKGRLSAGEAHPAIDWVAALRSTIRSVTLARVGFSVMMRFLFLFAVPGSAAQAAPVALVVVPQSHTQFSWRRSSYHQHHLHHYHHHHHHHWTVLCVGDSA